MSLIVGAEIDRPILFSPTMVRAIRDDKKTQTRRGANVRWDTSRLWGDYDCWTLFRGKRRVAGFGTSNRGQDSLDGHCPYGVRQSTLWVQETFYLAREFDKYRPTEVPEEGRERIAYFADGPKPEWAGKTRVARFMPRWASRERLLVDGVRLQQLQEMTDADALAEGVREVTKDGVVRKYCVYDMGDMSSTPWQDMPRTPREAFMALWDSLHAADGKSWGMNPWVWAITFTRMESQQKRMKAPA